MQDRKTYVKTQADWYAKNSGDTRNFGFKIGDPVRWITYDICGFIAGNSGQRPFTYSMLHNYIRMRDCDLEPCDFDQAMDTYIDLGHSSEDILKELAAAKTLSLGSV